VPADILGRNRLGLAGVCLLAAMVLVAVFAPLLSPYDPRVSVGAPFEKPSSRHWLGTNDIGQDILSEIIWGSRVSLLIGVTAALIAVSLGTTVGVVAGYCGGAVDACLMRIVDIILVIPFLPLMILLAAYLGPSFWNLVFVIGALVWARPARVIRAQVLSLRSRGYVQAAQAMRAGRVHILTRHILPGVLPLGLAQFVLAASSTILIEASMSFLGLGDPLRKSWGTVLYYAQVRGAFLSGAWLWWVIPPGLLITLAVMGFAFSGYALEDVLNPRLKKG
jgi:peptide/nickel transport system ATP-binding protein/peptide/nickel transport system permease protein